MIKSIVELTDESQPLLALAIHNGHDMHPDLLRICGIDDADRLREEDPYTDVFTKPYPNRIIVNTSRFTVDLNRKREYAIYQKPEDCWGLCARTQPIPDYLLMELSHDYGQWYSLLTFTIQRLLAKHDFLTILDLHSYNHRRQGQDAPPDSQIANPDIILGRNTMPESYYPWVEKIRSELNGKAVGDITLDCRIDVKFTGGWLSRWLHQTFSGQVVCLSIEFKKIFMNEWTGITDYKIQNELSQQLVHAVYKAKIEDLRL